MIAQIVCRGIGPGATIALLVTAGYALGVAAPPPPPPPVQVVEALSGGWLTSAQIARLRGWQAPPRRELVPDEIQAALAASRAEDAGEPGVSFAPPGLGLQPPSPGLSALLATARALDAGPQWAGVLALTQADAARRHALAAREDEEFLVLLLLAEVV